MRSTRSIADIACSVGLLADIVCANRAWRWMQCLGVREEKTVSSHAKVGFTEKTMKDVESFVRNTYQSKLTDKRDMPCSGKCSGDNVEGDGRKLINDELGAQITQEA